MFRRYWFASLLLLGASVPLYAQEKKEETPAPAPVPEGVYAAVESTLPTGGTQIRQYVLDGDDKTYFRSDKNIGEKDSFTLVLEKPVKLKSISVTTGRPADLKKPESGSDEPKGEPAPADKAELIETLNSGALEVSGDGKTFTKLADFAAGAAKGSSGDVEIKVIRIAATKAEEYPLVVREITIDAEPAVAKHKYPVEISVVNPDAPDLQEWLENVARVCERQYTMLNEQLKSDGYKPATQITITLDKNYSGVAEASGRRIRGSVKYYQSHKDDLGSMVHETAHVVQRYRGRNPSWLVEGVADYVRFFVYEPGKAGRLRVEQARYNASYRITAAFLKYLTDKYDKEIVMKLNKAMREGTYKESLFKDYTGKELTELDAEWRASLMPPKKEET